jgi:Zn-dependent M28 family amino/carboxypeptidase
VGAAALAVLSTLRNGNASPGGVDNAGSVAILRELARRLPEVVPDDVELIFLSTGAEEDHMVGAMRWLDRHLPELAGRPVHALNLDGAGAPGPLVAISRFGFGRSFSPDLAVLARDAARRLGFRLRSIWMPPAMGIDAIPFAHRGIGCLTLSSGSLGRATMAVHSANDHAEHLDRATLARSAALAVEIARDLLGDAGARSRGASATRSG